MYRVEWGLQNLVPRNKRLKTMLNVNIYPLCWLKLRVIWKPDNIALWAKMTCYLET